MKRKEWKKNRNLSFNPQRAKGKEHGVKDSTLCSRLYALCLINTDLDLTIKVVLYYSS
jgi:hypothetical protein